MSTFCNIICSILFVSLHLAEFLYGLGNQELDIRSVKVVRTEIKITDEFYLTVLNVSSCNTLQNVASEKVRGTCQLGNEVAFYMGMCKFQCSCLENVSRFVVNKKRCVDERKFRAGCQYVSGSWTWRNGWTWDNEDDALPILNIQSYGITTALNASTRLYTKCAIMSLDKFSPEGSWETLDPVFFQRENAVFFELKGMWHFSWLISELNSSRMDDIEGRFVRVNVRCSQINVDNGNILLRDVSSCLVFTITGNITYHYAANRTMTDLLPTSTTENSESMFSNRLLMVGCIAGAVVLLLLVAGILVYCIYGRKCIKSKTAVENESVMKYNCNDAVERV